MPVIIELRDDIEEYIQKHGLSRKWRKVKKFFENDPSHPSLNTELLELKHRLIYSFRIDKKYRALFICLPEDQIEIIAVTKSGSTYGLKEFIYLAYLYGSILTHKQSYFIYKFAI